MGIAAGSQVGSQERQREKEQHKTPLLYVPGSGGLALIQQKGRQTSSSRALRGREGSQGSQGWASAAGQRDLSYGSVDSHGQEVV